MAHNGNGANGMNGAANGLPNGMVGYPTPAGHQSDLNYVMSMVDELSAILRQNQQLTASVVEKMGKVRERAAGSNMTNDEVIAAVAEEMNGMAYCCDCNICMACTNSQQRRPRILSSKTRNFDQP